MGLWVSKRVTVDNFRKATLFNAFLDDKFKVILVGVGGLRNPMDSLTFPYFSRESSEVLGKWNCRFGIQLLGENENRQKFL